MTHVSPRRAVAVAATALLALGACSTDDGPDSSRADTSLEATESASTETVSPEPAESSIAEPTVQATMGEDETSGPALSLDVSVKLTDSQGYTGIYTASLWSDIGFVKDVSSSPPERAALTITGSRTFEYVDTTATRHGPTDTYDGLDLIFAAAYERQSPVCRLRKDLSGTFDPDDTEPRFDEVTIGDRDYCLLKLPVEIESPYNGDPDPITVIDDAAETDIDALLPAFNDAVEVIAYMDGGNPDAVDNTQHAGEYSYSFGETAEDPFEIEEPVCRFAIKPKGGGVSLGDDHVRMIATADSVICPVSGATGETTP